ncbi:MAG: 50S ribosomal protein L25 [Acidobacteriota bacterium]|nr:50S ribosomal protein L25 [Acidobacteriota bacterium]MDQ5836924.1 50S ribosomal protein L25 [Acidobacteriota bacterium]
MAEREAITVRAELRAGRGKNDARRLRARGMVPLTVYGGGGETVSAAAPLRELAAILRTESGHNTVFTLDVEGVGASEVLFLDRQIDPVKGRLVHADLRRLVQGEEVEVTVRLELDGEPAGVKEEGGILEQLLREVEIRCRPGIIPDAIHADVSALKVHEMLHVSDLKVEEGVTILTDPETAVATVAIVREEQVEERTPEEEVAEPEVIGKGKKEEEGE